jgi:hypothetical protein
VVRSIGPLIAVLSTGLLASACGASLTPSETEGHHASNQIGNSVSDTNIPVNRRFADLDEYLAYLEKTSAPVDGPWYKEVSPGLYQLQTGNLRVLRAENSEEKRLFTRKELEKKFGFSE